MPLFNSYVLSPLLVKLEYWYWAARDWILLGRCRLSITIHAWRPLPTLTITIYEFIAIICWHNFLFSSIPACISLSLTRFSHLTVLPTALFFSLDRVRRTRRSCPGADLVGLLCPNGSSLALSHNLCPELEHVAHQEDQCYPVSLFVLVNRALEKDVLADSEELTRPPNHKQHQSSNLDKTPIILSLPLDACPSHTP